MVDVSRELIEKCNEDLVEISKNWVGGVSNGATVYAVDDADLKIKAGDKVTRAHTACHSWVSAAFGIACYPKNRYIPNNDWSTPYEKGAVPFLTLTCHSRRRAKASCSPEASDFLVKWMAKESPFSKFILNRDDDEVLCEGGAVILCGPGGANLTEAMWICKVLRFITEGSKAADTFMTLVKGGVAPMLAVAVASHVRTIRGATFGYTGPDGHSSVFHFTEHPYDRSRSSIVGTVAVNFDKKAKTTSELFAAPKGVQEPKGIETKIKSFCKPYEKSDGWGGTVKGQGATAEDLIKNVLAWQHELEALINKEAPPLPTKSTVYLELDL